MRRFAALTTALALGLACALLVSSCGGSSGTLSSARSTEINDLLDQIQELADSGDCEGAGSLSQKVAQTIQARSDIDSKLRSSLVDGLERIQARSTDSSFCGGATDTTTTDTTATETTDTETTETPTQTQTQTQETTPTQTQQTQTQSTGTNPTDGGGTGGVGGSGGIGTP